MDIKIQLLEDGLEDLVCVAAMRLSLSVVFSRDGSSISCIPKVSFNIVCAASKMARKLREAPVLLPSLKILVEMSLRRSGVREYSVDRAKRTSFLTRDFCWL